MSASLLGRLSLAVVLVSAPVYAEPSASFSSRTLQRCEDKSPSLPEQSEAALQATVIIRTKTGMGSGVIISPDGFILTAAHVVTQNSVEVRLRNDEIVVAELLRLNEAQDVALLRVKDSALQLPCLQLDKEDAQIGEDIYVLGSPAGEQLSFSISRGIVSGLRSFKGTQFLQTDAAINPGNSGGPLVGSDGRVRAIASWKVADEKMEGLGFGVPSATALSALGLVLGDHSDAIEAPAPQRAKVKKAPVPHKPQVIDYPDAAPPSYAASKPGWVAPVRASGYLLAVAGVTAVISSWVVHLTTQDAQKFDSHKTFNTIGWVATGLGSGMVVSSYIWGSPAQKSTAGDVNSPYVSIGIGLKSLSLQGVY